MVLSKICITGTNIYKHFKFYRVDRNLRTVVYCNGLRYSESDAAVTKWDFLWQKLQSTKIASEDVTILSALGCTKNSRNLEL